MRAFLAAKFLKILGWQVCGDLRQTQRCVLIVAPHTSNWDFFIAMAIAETLGIKFQWLGKNSVFFWPVRPLLEHLGGIPVDRSAPHQLVAAINAKMSTGRNFILGLAPEGTRKRTQYWKSGFYYLAFRAKVPVICAYLDFSRKECGFSPELHLTGDKKRDMDRIREFYHGVQGRYPEDFGPVQLRNEERAPSS